MRVCLLFKKLPSDKIIVTEPNEWIVEITFKLLN